MNLSREFNKIKTLLDEAEAKIMKGVSMNKKRPVVEGRRMFRTIKERMYVIGQFAHQKVNGE